MLHTSDSQALRRSLGMFATGITVVTTLDAAGKPYGLTVNSFNSVSLDPPLIVWSLQAELEARPLFEQCANYAVNVLAADQENLSRHFASKQRNDFSNIEWSPARHGGAPLLAGCCAHFELANKVRHSGGDHLVFLSEVLHHEHFGHEPLLYFGGRYRQLLPIR